MMMTKKNNTSTAIVVRPPKANELLALRHLRYVVLDEPLGLTEKTGISEIDLHPDVILMAAFDGDKPVSCVRLEPVSRRQYVVRRLATHPDYQGRGIGSRMLTAAEKEAKDRGIKRLVLYAREPALGFCLNLGYHLTGNVKLFEDGENPEMVKDL